MKLARNRLPLNLGAALAFFAISLVSGCASQPSPSVRPTAAPAEVVIVNFVGNEVVHFHVGPTIFTNHESRYPARFDYRAALTREMVRAVSTHARSRGIVTALPPGLRLGQESGPPDTLFSGLIPEYRAALEQIAAQYPGRKLLVAVALEAQPINRGPKTHGFGLTTARRLTKSVAVAFSTVQLFALTPELESIDPSFGKTLVSAMSGSNDSRFTRLKDIQAPAKGAGIPPNLAAQLQIETPKLFGMRADAAAQLFN